jgi:hypothetical protein
LLGRDTDLAESGLQQFKRSATLRRRKQAAPVTEEKKTWLDGIAPGPKDAWMIYCWILTCCVPPFLLSSCGQFSFFALLFFHALVYPIPSDFIIVLGYAHGVAYSVCPSVAHANKSPTAPHLGPLPISYASSISFHYLLASCSGFIRRQRLCHPISGPTANIRETASYPADADSGLSLLPTP